VTLLAIESATDMVGAALVHPPFGPAERMHLGGRVHAELLVPSIEEVCAVSGCTVADIDVVSVDVGPGLFTGLRVGVATAKALAQALGIGVLAVGSLDILAAAALDRIGSSAAGWVVAVVDARRGEVFAAAYRGAADPATSGDPWSERIDRSGPLAPEALESWLVELAGGSGSPVQVVGDGAVRYRQQLSALAGLDLGAAAELSSPPPLAQAGLALRRLESGAVPSPPAEVTPDYRRPADARINWEQRDPRTAGPA
jgi:tRNA threonylcarbamoyladenosine biosynthesis protein TsaB